MDDLTQFITSLRTDHRINEFDEASTKQQVVLKILSLLGWDTFNAREVWPEFTVSQRRVDYCLKTGTKSAVFIEVKQAGEDLETHQEQLLDYSFKEGVPLAILTNGLTWWLYLPLREGRWEQRRFFAVDIAVQEPHDVADRFIEFLSKASVASGTAAQAASSMYEGNQRALALRNAMPEAWDKLVNEPDPLLIERLGEIAESLCGFRAEPSQIESFLASRKASLLLYASPAPVRLQPVPVRPPVGPGRSAPDPDPVPQDGYTGKKPRAIYLVGTRYEARAWNQVLLRLCEALSARHSANFESVVLNLAGSNRRAFSRDPKALRRPGRIAKTALFAELNVSAMGIIKRCQDLVKVFGHPAADFRVELA